MNHKPGFSRPNGAEIHLRLAGLKVAHCENPTAKVRQNPEQKNWQKMGLGFGLDTASFSPVFGASLKFSPTIWTELPSGGEVEHLAAAEMGKPV